MAMDEEGNYLVNGQDVMIPFIYKSTDNMMIQQIRQKGAGYSTEEVISSLAGASKRTSLPPRPYLSSSNNPSSGTTWLTPVR